MSKRKLVYHVFSSNNKTPNTNQTDTTHLTNKAYHKIKTHTENKKQNEAIQQITPMEQLKIDI